MGFQLSSLAFSEPKLKAKVITVTSGGTWRSSNKRINLDWVTHLKYTSVKIIRSKAKYHVGDTLVLEVIARDGNKRRKMPFFRMNLTADTKGPIIVSDVNENTTVKRPLPFCHPRLQHSEYQGFWLRGTWHSLSCKVRQFSSREITKCLTNRTVHFRGDSTLRQWIQRLGELKIMHPGPGDPYFRPYTNNRRQIQVTFKFHTVPIQVSAWFKFKNLTDSGVSNDIMKMIGGENVVLVLSLCSHFTAEPTHVYTFRMYELRSAIEQLHKKYPKTTVIVKTCNTRNHRHYREVVQMSDWLADQLNQEMRNILGSLNVAILDVWDMTVSQWYPYNIHPHEHVVDNELNMLMSYICPMMVKNV
ncbi:NXPE family member 3-like isoform X2 [Branchiostoma floridae]|uniref:NXPE family member 3-like isoform X2 n=1 Tax=Branchiostoma floridae TaxID=7739 RepID=A0A9J7MUQ6_BRAFL|nr:NXPE family member 3-like isoform X2 [Branchiostoma floridae]